MSAKTATATTPAAETISTTPAETSSANKLYVGNIEYHTTRKDLEELFKDYEIESVEIPTRRAKSKGSKGFSTKAKGYVFVTFGDKHSNELDSIIKKFTDFKFKDRKIYLRYPIVSTIKEEGGNKNYELDVNGEVNPKSGNLPKAEASKKPTAKTPAKKERILFDQGEKSTDTLYLKNLDFSVKSIDIKEFFEAEGEAPEWVSVPFNKLPSWILKKKEVAGESLERRNKGYAFVKLTLKNGETIEEKVQKFYNKSFKDRDLLVSVAIDVRNVKTQA